MDFQLHVLFFDMSSLRQKSIRTRLVWQWFRHALPELPPADLVIVGVGQVDDPAYLTR